MVLEIKPNRTPPHEVLHGWDSAGPLASADGVLARSSPLLPQGALPDGVPQTPTGPVVAVSCLSSLLLVVVQKEAQPSIGSLASQPLPYYLALKVPCDSERRYFRGAVVGSSGGGGHLLRPGEGNLACPPSNL